jgi:diguanylate cyclase (GGDEF)-like protein
MIDGNRALHLTSALVSVYDRTGQCIYMNPAAKRVFAADAVTLGQRIVPHDLSETLLAFDEAASQGDFVAAVDTVLGRRIHEMNVAIDTEAGEKQLTITAMDVTDREMDRERMRFLARHDSLTGLINRNAATELIEDMIALDAGNGMKMRVCLIDLDRFKLVNEAMGYKAGDFVLVEVARRLKARLPRRFQIARTGGDSFLIFCCSDMDDMAFAAMMQAARADLARPYRIMDRTFELGASMGLAVYPDHGTSSDELLNAADLATVSAKDGDGNRLCSYDETMCRAQVGLLQMNTDLRDALRNDRLSMWFQPRIKADGCTVAGVEALARWIREDGHVSPDQFVPVAEETGLIHDLGCWVLRAAAMHQACLRKAGYDICMSVNVSAKQFSDPALVDCLEEIAADPAIDPARFELEITETVLVRESPRLSRVLKRIVDLGFPMAIDDFGTAYSNMAALRRYPIDCIKIDRSLVTSDGFKHLTLGVITMAKALDVRVVAEGVENRAQVQWLAENGCDEFQGHFFRGAMPFDKLTALLGEAQAGRA